MKNGNIMMFLERNPGANCVQLVGLTNTPSILLNNNTGHLVKGCCRGTELFALTTSGPR
jgi:hypothetical protein